MSNNNLKVLIAILSIAVLGGAFFYFYKPGMEEVDSLKSEAQSQKTRYEELAAKNKDRKLYIENTAKYKEEVLDILAYFAPNLDQEQTVMFLKGVEETFEFSANSATLGRPTMFYVLGSGAVTGANVENIASDAKVCTYAEFPISYEGEYEGIKDILDYVNNYKYKMNITSSTISYDMETKLCTGTINLVMYSVSGTDALPDDINIDVPTGVENLFLGGGSGVTSQTYSHDADNGATIATDNDIVITLNNSENDAASGIIVSSGNDKTYVTSSENKVEDLKVTVYEEDGKKFAKYAIGDQSYDLEIKSTSVKVYVKSSKRVDGEDKNGVKVTVANDTDLPVFFKVADDDTASPRFKVVNKQGAVKVY